MITTEICDNQTADPSIANNNKILLTVTALIEVGAGLLMVVLPSQLTNLLLGSSLETTLALILARIAGVVLLLLGVACWFARNNGQNHSTRGLISVMLLYNDVIVIGFFYAGIRFRTVCCGFMACRSASLCPGCLVHLKSVK